MAEIDYTELDEEVNRAMTRDSGWHITGNHEASAASRGGNAARGRYMDMVHPSSDMRPPTRGYATGRAMAAPKEVGAGFVRKGGAGAAPAQEKTTRDDNFIEDETPEFGVIEDVRRVPSGRAMVQDMGDDFDINDDYVGAGIDKSRPFGGGEDVLEDEMANEQAEDFISPSDWSTTDVSFSDLGEVRGAGSTASAPKDSAGGRFSGMEDDELSSEFADEPSSWSADEPNANNYSLGGRSPFIPDAKVEKRPLGDHLPEGSAHGIRSTKNVYSQRTPAGQSAIDMQQPMVVGTREKKSGWVWALVTLLVLALGGGLGVLVYVLYTNQ